MTITFDGPITRIIGVDPGLTPGFVVLNLDRDVLEQPADVAQCSARLLYTLVATFNADRDALIAVERFVPRGRLTAEQRVTQAQAENLTRIHPRVVQRPAAAVKPWATDERLAAAGLLEACKGMRHARDAARHALYAAVHDAGLPDPLSKSWNR